MQEAADMGCVESSEASDTEEPKQYSWDKRAPVDPANYSFKNLEGQTVGKKSGEINGEQFVIENCKNCNIFVQDCTAIVNVDDCENCTIFLGPVKGSVFVRDCSNCKIIVACQQFRSRDCKNVEILLCCHTLPIIEASSDMKFGCFRCSYMQLAGQFSLAGLSPFSNNWGKIHDFTKSDDGKNFSFADETPDWLDEFVAKLPDDMSPMDTSLEKATVPVTLGPRPAPEGEQCLAVVFHELHAKKLLKAVRNASEIKGGPSIAIAQTKAAAKMNKDDAVRIFAREENVKFAEAAEKGPVIGIEFIGISSVSAIRAAVTTLGDALVYMSADSASGAADIESFYNYMDISLKA
eukprot:m.50287 g.50287  ORF g.50287 m.50287 type:complete len:350 (-) comp10658_c0_seq3:2130-3179(-)